MGTEQDPPVRFYEVDPSRISLGTGIKVRAQAQGQVQPWFVDISQLTRESLGEYIRGHGGAEAVLMNVLRYRDG